MLTTSHSRIKRNKRILKKNPVSQKARVNLGLLYFKNKQYDKALEHLTEAENLAGEDLSIKKMLAIVYLANKNYRNAKEVLHQILEKDPEDADVHQHLSMVCVHENDYSAAIGHLKKAAALRKNDAEVWNDLGALSYALNDIESARTYFAKAVEVDDAYALSYLNLMDLYLREKNTDDALRVCNDFVKRFPDDPTAFKYRGLIARADGRFSEAIGYFSLARKQVKDDPEISYHLGLSLMSIGDFESAAKSFRNTLDIDPEYPSAKRKLVACYCKLEGAHSAFRLLKDEINDVGWKAAKRHQKKEKKQHVALSILVPAFNEAERILTNTRKIKRWAAALGRRFEIIVVDDGSEDDTYEILELLSRNIKEVRPYRSKSNKGKGMALREAALKASGELVVFLDADLELHPSLIPEMIRRMEDAGADVVLGSKRHPESKVNYPWHRKLLSNGYYMVNRMLFGLPVKDTQTGIKVFKKAVLDDVIPRLIEKQYAFDLELIVNVHVRGYKIIEAPIELKYSRGFGRIGGGAVMRTALDTLAIFYRLRILKYYDR
ncbi:MAG: glycosyltransferase, partial [Deltaproteobacteria bacterium]|nr:glycosyltransferase [Deltaproteobacteria bacterium]